MFSKIIHIAMLALLPLLAFGQQQTWSRVYDVSIAHTFSAHELTIRDEAAAKARALASQEFGSGHVKVVSHISQARLEATLAAGAASVQVLTQVPRLDAQGARWSDFRVQVNISHSELERQFAAYRDLEAVAYRSRYAARTAEILEHQLRAQRNPTETEHRLAVMVLQGLQRAFVAD